MRVVGERLPKRRAGSRDLMTEEGGVSLLVPVDVLCSEELACLRFRSVVVALASSDEGTAAREPSAVECFC